MARTGEDEGGGSHRSVQLEVKVSAECCLGVSHESQIFHISGAEHNSISGLYRGLLCDSELEHLSVSGPGLHSAGGLTLSSENRELVDKRTARVLI